MRRLPLPATLACSCQRSRRLLLPQSGDHGAGLAALASAGASSTPTLPLSYSCWARNITTPSRLSRALAGSALAAARRPLSRHTSSGLKPSATPATRVDAANVQRLLGRRLPAKIGLLQRVHLRRPAGLRPEIEPVGQHRAPAGLQHAVQPHAGKALPVAALPVRQLQLAVQRAIVLRLADGGIGQGQRIQFDQAAIGQRGQRHDHQQ